jgi:hypothetical protein
VQQLCCNVKVFFAHCITCDLEARECVQCLKFCVFMFSFHLSKFCLFGRKKFMLSFERWSFIQMIVKIFKVQHERAKCKDT